MYLHPRILITSGMIWSPYDWLSKFYRFISPLQSVLIAGMVVDLKCIIETNLIGAI